MKDKYIFFDSTMRQGGAERVISILSRKMAEEGKQVEILIYYDLDPFYEIDTRVKFTRVCKETGTKNMLKNLLWMRRYFSQNAKIVISFLAPFNILALISTMFSNIKIIVADRNDPRYVPGNRIIRKLRDFLYSFADGVVLQTTNNKLYFNNAIQRKSTVILNPIDMGDYAGSALKVQKQKKITTVGRLIKQKNPMMVVQAFQSFVRDFPEYQLVCYGEGDMRQELEEYVKKSHLQNRIFFPGAVKNVFDHIKDAEIFVLASDYEGMPNALAEAMCLGLAVISTKVSGAVDMIRHEENGVLIEIGNESELFDVMKKMASDQQYRERLASNATKLNNLLESKMIMNQWIDFINAVLARR